MLTISRTPRVFLATGPTDMRKGFDGLFALLENVVREDPFSGHLFVFRNQRRDRRKVLWWDRDGLAIFYKRLERGGYEFPTDRTTKASSSDSRRLAIFADQLALLLEGIDLASVKRRPRYQRAATCSTNCFSFWIRPGIEPTNNRAERALRHFVIWRKLSFGTQSPEGSRFVETMLSVVETCRQQNRSTFDFVTTAVELYFRKLTAPSLLGL